MTVPHNGQPGFDLTTDRAQDAHALAHANDIRRLCTGQRVTTGQIVMFGLTGGLFPCLAAITVLVLCFSIGLAITLVAAGIIAALSNRHVWRRWVGFDAFAQRAPYFSSAVIICVDFYVGWHGLATLVAAGVV